MDSQTVVSRIGTYIDSRVDARKRFLPPKKRRWFQDDDPPPANPRPPNAATHMVRYSLLEAAGKRFRRVLRYLNLEEDSKLPNHPLTKQQMLLSAALQLPKEKRRRIHDDITVLVVLLDDPDLKSTV